MTEDRSRLARFTRLLNPWGEPQAKPEDANRVQTGVLSRHHRAGTAPVNRVPKPDEKYADNGRREAIIGEKTVSYHLREMSRSDPEWGRATHVVTIRHMSIPDNTRLRLGGVEYTVVSSRDANHSGLTEMKGKFTELLCNQS